MKLIATAIVLAGLVPFSYQFTVNSPASVTECEPTMLSWNGGVPPYYPALIPPGQPGGQAIKQFPETNSTSLTWRVDLPAGTGFSISLTDSTGQTVYSSTENVQSGPDSSCVNSSVSESDVQAGPTAASSMGASSTGATTTGAAIAAASTSSGSSSSGSSSASKTGSATSSGATPSKTSNSAGRGPSIGAYGAAAVLAAAGAVLF